MLKRIIIFMVGGFFLISAVSAWGMDAALLSVIQSLTEEKIVVWAKDPVIVNTVKEANKKAMLSQEEIDRADKKWQTAEEIDHWIDSFLNNECAMHLKKLQNKKRGKRTLYPEIFVMDHQGLIVAESDKTLDYWHGDENRFIKSFAQGKGSIFVDEPDFDLCTQSFSIQVSAPILDPDTGRAIGVMTVGIGLDALTEYMLDL
ncbi:MAG: PDC sensor domain-containing protein [Candidatus Omnitrophica bacterium]|nr:PDC sensor domain-containing protein [Candidatus Omnitrophota bacterium]